MVSNYDRIFQEIRIEAQRVAEDLDIDAEILARLTLEIVDLEDQHRISHIHDINKRIRALIEDTAVTQVGEGS